MGLDLVELTMEIEDRFGIIIPDADASRIETVGQTYEYLRQRLTTMRGDRCVSMHVFHQLRRVFVNEFGIQRAAVRPSTAIASLVGSVSPAAAAARIARASELTLPPILDPCAKKRTDLTALLLVVLAAFTPFAVLRWDWALTVGIFATIALLLMISRILRHSAWHVHRVLTSDGLSSLVREVVTVNKLAATSSEWTDERIWLVLKEIIIEQLGVRPEQVTRDAYYVRDLHAS